MGYVEPWIYANFIRELYHYFNWNAFGAPCCIINFWSILPLRLIGTIGLHPIHKSDLPKIFYLLSPFGIEDRTCVV